MYTHTGTHMDIACLKQFLMPCQVNICNGIQTNYIKTDAFIISPYNIVQDFFINTGIVAKIPCRSPAFIPPQIKEQKICDGSPIRAVAWFE